MFKSLVRKFLASAVGIFLYGYVALPALAQSVEAAERTEPYRVFAVVWRGETEVEDGFREYFTQRGIPFEMTVRNLNLDRGNAPAFVEEIKQAQPDLVYTWGTGTTTSVWDVMTLKIQRNSFRVFREFLYWLPILKSPELWKVMRTPGAI